MYEADEVGPWVSGSSTRLSSPQKVKISHSLSPDLSHSLSPDLSHSLSPYLRHSLSQDRILDILKTLEKLEHWAIGTFNFPALHRISYSNSRQSPLPESCAWP